MDIEKIRSILDSSGIDIGEFMVLYALGDKTDAVSNLEKLGLCSDNKVTDEGQALIDSVVDAMDDSELSIDDTIEEMRALFPKGMKTGSTPWRGNLRNLRQRLEKFLRLYDPNGKYTQEDIVNATKRYVESFGNDRKYMRALPYFIMKDESRIGGGEVSDLASYLENTDEPQQSMSDWLSEMK